jgi:pimeloyl-ACP methyl ester carboxylesterase
MSSSTAAPRRRSATGMLAAVGAVLASTVAAASAGIEYRTTEVAGLKIFYREAGPADAPTILLLHGFPTSSHMFRDLLPKLAETYHVVAPDYPGYGYSDAPSVDAFDYSFEKLADVVGAFTEKLGLQKYSLYIQDFGSPVGMRLATRHPDRVEALIVQNAVAHVEGLSPEGFAPARAFWADRNTETEAAMRGILTLDATKFQYLHGAQHPERISPDAWTFDQALLDRPGNAEIQLALLYDYRNNPPSYPKWQAFLRDRQPPTLIVWGRNDPFFTVAGAEGFKREVPDAELHWFEGGHFMLEEHADEVATLIKTFLSSRLARPEQ